MITEFRVSGMHCNSCISLIKLNVQELEGVANISGELECGVIKVSYDEQQVTAKDIVQKIEAEGYKVTGYGRKREFGDYNNARLLMLSNGKEK